MTFRVCLIVDNPLRDLDGLVLVAWQLAQQGIEAYLVPMYNQAFDVIAIEPDLVLVNHSRPHNVEQLWRFHTAGIRVGVLDTEGSPGRNVDGFADMVKRVNSSFFVDMYCIWGLEQYETFKRHNVIPEKRLVLTGCPRYDYCVPPLRKILPKPQIRNGYILVNTSFPLANPRFTSGADDELKTMIKVGYDPIFAESVVKDTVTAIKNVVDVIGEIAGKFPEQNIVIRPHPFESLSPYNGLAQKDNVFLEQRGTSLEWIESACVLVHLNCITAVEAIMLDVETISLEWINTPALLSQSPPVNVNLQAKSQDHLESMITEILSGKKPHVTDELADARHDIICKRYYKNDGISALRVADAIRNVITSSDRLERKKAPRFNVKPTIMHVAKMMFGYKLFHYLKRGVQGSKNDMRLAAKLFKLEQVKSLVQRINNIDDKKRVIHATYAPIDQMKKPRLASGQVIKLFDDTLRGN